MRKKKRGRSSSPFFIVVADKSLFLPSLSHPFLTWYSVASLYPFHMDAVSQAPEASAVAKSVAQVALKATSTADILG